MERNNEALRSLLLPYAVVYKNIDLLRIASPKICGDDSVSSTDDTSVLFHLQIITNDNDISFSPQIVQ